MSKLRFENDKRKNSGNKVFYIASAVCVLAIGFLGFRALSEKNDAVKTQENTSTVPVTQPMTTAQEDDWDAIAQEVDAQFESEEALEVAAEPEEKTTSHTTTVSTAKKAEKVTYTLPLNGKLYKNFSGTELVFSETMGDWRVHEGVDISCAKGDKVKTAAAGEVLDVIADDLLGTTVIIRHNDGLMAYYCGLSSKALVKKGEKISSGTVIGSIDCVPIEINDPPHLHLAVKKDGEWADPIKAMDLKLS